MNGPSGEDGDQPDLEDSRSETVPLDKALAWIATRNSWLVLSLDDAWGEELHVFAEHKDVSMAFC